MSKSLTNYMSGANLPDLTDEDMAGALAEATNDATGGAAGGAAGGAQFLTFSGKSGKYSLGRNKAAMDPDDLYILEPQMVTEGWTCWKGSKPISRCEWSIYKRAEQEVFEKDLEDHGPYKPSSGDGWQRMIGFGMLGTDDEHTQVKFSSTSKSGRNAISDLLNEVRARSSAGDPNMPVISFSEEEFTAQDQKNYKPVMTVDCWVTRAAVGAYLAGDMSFENLQAGKAPKKGKKKK